MNKEEIITAEEFIREKIRKSFGIDGEMKALNMYAVSGEDALRWAHEFASIPTHKEETKKLISYEKIRELHSGFVRGCITFEKYVDSINELSMPQPLKPLSDEEIKARIPNSVLDEKFFGAIWMRDCMKNNINYKNIPNEKENWGSTFGLLTLEQINDKNFARFCESIDKKNKEISHLRSQLRLYKQERNAAVQLINVINHWLKNKVPKKFVDISKISDLINSFLQTLKQE